MSLDVNAVNAEIAAVMIKHGIGKGAVLLMLTDDEMRIAILIHQLSQLVAPEGIAEWLEILVVESKKVHQNCKCLECAARRADTHNWFQTIADNNRSKH